jgi:ribonuclease HI
MVFRKKTKYYLKSKAVFDTPDQQWITVDNLITIKTEIEAHPRRKFPCRKKNKHIHFVWILEHIDIPGNEMTDKKAHNAIVSTLHQLQP